MTHVYAYTAPGYIYPAYINVQVNGKLVVTVRHPAHETGDGRQLCGASSTIELDRHQAILLMDALVEAVTRMPRG